MMRLNISRNLLLLAPVILLAGCTAAAYQRLEEASLPRYQKGTPVMSTIQVVCRRISVSDAGHFQVSYDLLWDVTNYPTTPDPIRYETSWCTNGVQVFHQTEQNKNYKYDNSSLDGGNKDPQKGAVNTWQMAVTNMDGLNARSTLIQFGAAVVEGDRYPLGGGGFSVFGSPYCDMVLYEPDSTFVANGLQWQKKTWREIFHGGNKNRREPGELMEVYQAKVGNYSVLVYGKFTKPIVEHPDWLEKRRAFLRQWVETFKVEPIKP